MRPEAEEWLRAAEDDLLDAKVLLGAGRYAAAAFHAHQAAEKALKAAIIALRGELPPKTHNLVRLASILGVDDEDIMDALRMLNPHYRVARYPDAANGVPMEVYSARISSQLVNLAERVVKWVKKLLASKT
ncbi:HEPN domain protein [Pyrolobus fumarii 1A]|uniref:HEPN domain protein n=1 Tax=Pyrolobus fumarii (strain DSM 11204 / 1A) TaxID=694429 RepID=G0EH01_PYRF1|nr:HEPN domain-containing protein [Pyrolobus fumarii]AEM38451.1 HEPN domain protein [Pyrolobus fumarii 1A]